MVKLGLQLVVGFCIGFILVLWEAGSIAAVVMLFSTSGTNVSD